MTAKRGLYIEILIRSEIDEIWRLTQEPALHQRWDLRFSRIDYLPRPDAAEPQRFLYATRIGFGMSVEGTGESRGEHDSVGGGRTSALKFASADWKSLIVEGSGYWRYVPDEAGVRFLTWYDYKVRFGLVGRVADHLVFRPLMGWATAWSFDRLRIWAETGETPESTMRLSLIHAVARSCLAMIWIWHGLVPKLLYRSADELTMLAQAGLPLGLLPWIGAFEIVFGLSVLFGWRWRWVFPANVAIMVAATISVARDSPHYVTAAFNPVTLNLAVIALSIAGWLSSAKLATARRCLRAPLVQTPVKEQI